MAVLGLTHLGICVSDPERSRRFYTEVLGFRPVSRLTVAGAPTTTLMELDAVELHCLFLERDGFRIELMHHAVPGPVGDGAVTPFHRRGLTHLAFRVDDLEQTLAAVVAGGGRVLEATRIHSEEFGSHVACAADPDGVRLELIQSGTTGVFDPLGEPIEG